MSSTDCESGSECSAGVCQPIGTGGFTSSTGGNSSDGGSVATGGTADTGGSVGTGGSSVGGSESGGSNAGGSSAGSESGGSSSGGTSSGGTSSGGTSSGGDATGGGGPAPELIDDLEDGDGRILANSGRQGPWHVFNSSDVGAGKASSPEMGGHSGQYAMHTSGMGYTFAGLGFGLNNSETTPESAQSKAYDASAFTGVSFWIKAGSNGSASLRVEAPMRDFVPTERGGTCSGTCWNVYGAAVTTPLTANWQEIRIPFASMQRESGTTPAFDAKQLMTISFKHTGNNDRFDFWIDDVGFYK